MKGAGPAVIQRILRPLRGLGLTDGMWTLAVSMGSKLQILTLMAAAGYGGSVEDVGYVVLVVAIANLVMAITDAGLSAATLTNMAAGRATNAAEVAGILKWRLLLDISAGGLATWVLVSSGTTLDRLTWAAAGATFCAGLHASSAVTHIAFGRFHFRSGALINAAPRLLSVPLLLIVAVVGLPMYALILVLAAAEIVIAAAQYRRISAGDAALKAAANGAQFGIRHTWRFGITAVVNIAINKSDAVLVGVVGAAAVVGTYGIASQAENALTTLALVPAGSLVAHAARRNASSFEVRRLIVGVGRVVMSAYILIAIPLLAFPSELASIFFGVDISDPLPIRICVIAGVLSCASAVFLQALAGLNEQTVLVRVWVATFAVTVVAMPIGVAVAGATGASLGALARDLVLLILSGYYFYCTTSESHDVSRTPMSAS